MRKKDEKLLLEKERTLLAEEQTILSKERTILAFMQTGLAFIAVGLAVVNFFKGTPSHAVGWVLVGIGFAEVFESLRRLLVYRERMKEVKEKMKKEIKKEF